MHAHGYVHGTSDIFSHCVDISNHFISDYSSNRHHSRWSTYQGADPYGSAISSPIRQVSSISPASPVYGDIKGVAMACGGDAKAASMTVPMTAGSDVRIYWGSVSPSLLRSFDFPHSINE